MSIRRVIERSLTFPVRKPRHDPEFFEDRPPTPEPPLIVVQPFLKRKQSHPASALESEQDQLLALRAEIAQCDAEDAELRVALANVRARKQQVIARLHAFFRTPANRLSPLVLSLIFQYLDIRTVESVAMLVSRRWRRTALSTPELWNTIQLHRGPTCARAFIRRAKGLPLFVELHLPEPRQGERVDWALSNLKRPGDAELFREREIERLFAPVLPFASSWAALRVRAPDVFSMQSVLGCCARAGGVRALRELELGVARLTGPETSVSDFSQVENFLNLEGESLKRVALTNMAWQWSPYALGCVSDLAITLVNPDETPRAYDLPSYFGTLVGAASLRTLAIRIEGNITVSLPDEPSSDSGSRISSSTPPAIVLPFLTHLSLYGSIPPTLLRLFNTPALRRLDLTLARRASTPLLPRGHNIHDLRLDGTNTPNIRLFQSLPKLVRLELGRDMPGRLLDVLARHSQADDPEQTPIAPSSSQNTGRGLDEVLCPLLDTLTLRGCERIKRESVEGLVERRAGSLRKVRMFGCEGIGLKGELRRTGTWMPPPVRGGSTRSGKGGGVILKKVELVRRDTAAGFVIVGRDVRRAGIVTG